MEGLLSMIYAAMDVLLPFDWAAHDFMKRAFLAAVFIAPTAAVMGIHVVNFRMSFFSDAISHSAFTGVAIGILVGLSPMLTMVIFGLLVGVVIVRVRKKTELSVDTIIGVAFSTSVALGIVIISAQRGLTKNLHNFIYGDVLAVGGRELSIIFLLAAAVLIFTVLSYNRLILMSVNNDVARTRGVNTALYEYVFSILLALVVCVGIRVVGILLVTALVIVPAAAGRSLSRNIGELFWFSTAAAITASITGIIFSYYYDTATGATIVLFCAVFFFLAQMTKGFRRRSA